MVDLMKSCRDEAVMWKFRISTHLSAMIIFREEEVLKVSSPFLVGHFAFFFHLMTSEKD